jgi:Right handed beta helix region
MRIERSCPCLLFLVAVVVAAMGASASPRANQTSMRFSTALPANIIVVTNTNDSGPGSLRDALAIANDGDTIDATGVSGMILLTSGELNVDKNVTIGGPGANHLAVDGNGQSRLFYVNLGKTVFVSGLTITNGTNGIYNDGGALTLSDCAVSGNSVAGIVNYSLNGSATMTVVDSTISGNSGGGIGNIGLHAGVIAALTVSNCTISANSGGGIGNGGAFGGRATMTLTNSTVSGNSGRGVANWVTRGGAMLTISNSTISGNSGGGMTNSAENGGATLTISNSTISGNSASWGGGIANSNGQGGGAVVDVSNSTISGNSASYGGGGVVNQSTNGGSSTVNVSNSTISDNSAVDGGGIYNSNGGTTLGGTILKASGLGENIFNLGGTVSSHEFNVSSDDGGGYLNGAGDQINTDPLLGALQDNGGPTFTHALLPGSPAINAGDPTFTPPPFYDQRGPGFNRVVNGRIDIGSFEVQLPRTTPTPRQRPTPHPRP